MNRDRHTDQLEEIIGRLSERHEGKSGIIETNIDWLISDSDSGDGLKAARIMMHPETAADLARLSDVLRDLNLPQVEVVLRPDMAKGSNFCDAAIWALPEELDEEVKIRGAAESSGGKPKDSCDFSIAVNAAEARLIVKDNEGDDRGVIVFGPDRLADYIRKSAGQSQSAAKRKSAKPSA